MSDVLQAPHKNEREQIDQGNLLHDKAMRMESGISSTEIRNKNMFQINVHKFKGFLEKLNKRT